MSWINSKEKIVRRKGGKTYRCVMYTYAGPRTNNLTSTSNRQKEILNKLLRMLTNTGYRTPGPMIPISTIVQINESGTNYRIDNQTRVDLNDSDARLNIHYQIGGNSHAMVLVSMRPEVAPREFQNQLIDNESSETPDGFGFTPNDVMGFIQSAMRHSAENGCYTYVRWRIEEVTRSRSRSGDRNELTNLGNRGNISAEEGLVGFGAKVVTKKVILPQVAKQAAKSGSKKIPFVGLGFGLAFGAYRLVQGDMVGALGEVASGAVSCVPVVGTAASVGVDALLCVRDIKK